MLWDCDSLINVETPVILPCSFNSQLLAVDISVSNLQPTWYKSGFLQAFITLQGQKFAGIKFTTAFKGQLIEIPYSSYQLEFQKQSWMQNARIRIKQLSSTQLKEIIMSASYDSSNRPVGNDSAATVTAAVTNTVLAAANLSRAPEGFIVNNSNKNLWVTFTGTAATAAAPATKVLPNGGNIDIPGNYTGVINGIWEAAATGSCVVHEFSYI